MAELQLSVLGSDRLLGGRAGCQRVPCFNLWCREFVCVLIARISYVRWSGRHWLW